MAFIADNLDCVKSTKLMRGKEGTDPSGIQGSEGNCGSKHLPPCVEQGGLGLIVSFLRISFLRSLRGGVDEDVGVRAWRM